MEIRIRYVGGTIIEMTCTDGSGSIIEDVTKLDGTIQDGLIENLREVANRLEEHHEYIEAKQA